MGTYALAKKRGDRNIRFVSLNFKEKGVIEFTLDNLEYTKAHDWVELPERHAEIFEGSRA